MIFGCQALGEEALQGHQGKVEAMKQQLCCSSDGKESVCNTGDQCSIPGSGRCPGGGNGSPDIYPGMELLGCMIILLLIS